MTSPLAAYLGFGLTEDFFTSYDVQRERTVELAIDECMTRLGFDYEQKAVSVETVRGTTFGADLDRLTYAQTYGFSVSTLFEDILLGSAIAEPRDLNGLDPNFAIVNELSSTERDAWYQALGGDSVLIDPVTGEAFDPRSGEVLESYDGPPGCAGEAEAAADTQFGGLIELLPLVGEIDERVDGDERVLEAIAAWSDCMAEQGYSYGSRQEMWSAAFEEFIPLRTEILTAVQGPASSEPIEITDNPNDQTPIPLDLVARLDEVKASEIATAVASYGCDDIEATRRLVRNEYEQSFIANNQAALDTVGSS